MAGTLDLTAGLAADFLRQVRPSAGVTYSPTGVASPFTGAEPLVCKVWEGDDLAPVCTPAASWVDATIGTFLISVSGANAALLSQGTYQYVVTATSAGKTGPIDRGQVRVAGAPGTGTRPLAFTTYDDLLRYLPMVEQIQANSSLTGFAEEQARATNQLISGIVALSKRMNYGPEIGHPGFTAVSLGMHRSEAPDWWLRQQIVPLTPNSTAPAVYPYRQTTQANLIDPRVSTALLLYDEVKEICAKWALSYVLRSQITRVSDQDWWSLAREFSREANERFRSQRFEIDLSVPQSGYASIVIDGGSTSLR